MRITFPDREAIQARIAELQQELRKLLAVEDALKRAEPRRRPRPKPDSVQKAVARV